MATMIHDPVLEQRLRDERKASGADRYDEVWEGVYVMAPMPNHEHQRFVARWTGLLDEILAYGELGEVVPGVNVSDRVQSWEHNYRVPDVAVFLKTTKAENHDTFWYGGPDFAIEIISHDDQSRKKLTFYASVGTREILLIDRDPWQLEVYRLSNNELKLVTQLRSTDRQEITIEVIPLTISWMEAGTDRPKLLVKHLESGRSWTI
jgi:Uma2 family endonuclease